MRATNVRTVLPGRRHHVILGRGQRLGHLDLGDQPKRSPVARFLPLA